MEKEEKKLMLNIAAKAFVPRAKTNPAPVPVVAPTAMPTVLPPGMYPSPQMQMPQYPFYDYPVGTFEQQPTSEQQIEEQLKKDIYGDEEETKKGGKKEQKKEAKKAAKKKKSKGCLLYTSPSPRDLSTSRMPSSA
eukprot:TRINITY_DN3666_c0_g1_i5.p4 TRINITY_DN3666_c0_g1~~TRINITY_DN3666_c0_g1_i5.p4  ORF type:complete len:135 (+),score=36.48 TRINITY_DN3666_c0_g1_i5:181-585(+)